MTRLRNWHDGHPDVGRIVWVWAAVTAILAVWDGTHWRTTEGQVLRDISHWHEQ
jgi:hypothetical protein